MRPLLGLGLALAGGSGCLVDHEAYETRLNELTDDDGDGFTEVDGDCDDLDPMVATGLTELCDGVDNDCDGEIDEEASDAGVWFIDSDGDGYGTTESRFESCEAPSNASSLDGDCDDEDPEVFPEADETWDNGIFDNDCDDEVEEIEHYFGEDGWTGASADARAGLEVAAAGDLNGDGLADTWGTAPLDSMELEYSGAIHLILGGTEPQGLESVPTVRSTELHAAFGSSLSVDPADPTVVVVGSTGTNDGAGTAYLLDVSEVAGGAEFSPEEVAIGTLNGPNEGNYFGGTVAALGDVTGDGVADYAASAVLADSPTVAGAGVVGLDSAANWDGGVATDTSWTAYGWYEEQGLGKQMFNIGDWDNDGIDDIMLAANEGLRALVLPGGEQPPDDLEAECLFIIWGENEGNPLLSPVGDLDGDGEGDLLVKDKFTTYIFTGLRTSPYRHFDEPSATLHLADGELGYPVGLGDLDGDGLEELWSSSLWDEERASAVGAILMGSDYSHGSDRPYDDGYLIAPTRRTHSYLGTSAAVVGDTDGDGQPELALGGPADTEADLGAGVVVLLTIPE